MTGFVDKKGGWTVSASIRISRIMIVEESTPGLPGVFSTRMLSFVSYKQPVIQYLCICLVKHTVHIHKDQFLKVLSGLFPS